MRETQKHALALFDTALQGLATSLLTMSSLALRNLEGASRGLLNRDTTLCRLVVGDDAEVDDLERAVDYQAMQVLLRYSPVAEDLRIVLSSMRIASNLERVSDQAVRVARRARKLNKRPELLLTRTIEPLLGMAMELIRDGMKSFAERDIPLAQSVIARDQELDRAYHAFVRELTTGMEIDPANIRTYLHLTFAARALERVGDCAVNIAEEVIFIREGGESRHAPRSRHTQSDDDGSGQVELDGDAWD